MPPILRHNALYISRAMNEAQEAFHLTLSTQAAKA